MSPTRDPFAGTAALLTRYRGLLLSICAAATIFVILVPLPPIMLDVLLAANIALAAIVLLTAIHVASPLEFSVFPSLLLGLTLFRLTLNIATTRLILTAGAGGNTPQEAQQAAGSVVWAFGQFVTNNSSLAVGVVLFIIIAIIQFVVVTKGAARISEVAARFVLDAMPGKQMAIDAELNAGIIKEDQARARRSQLDNEADFYGAMDGASKFLRGDAIACVAIAAVNIIGGLYIGRAQYGWSWAETADVFTRLTIGEGLVMQVPAFIISMAAAIIVTRGGAKRNLGEDVISQLTARPAVLAVTGVFLVLLSLTSLPKLPLLLIAAGCGGLAWMLYRRRGSVAGDAPDASGQGREALPERGVAKAVPGSGENLDELMSVDPLRIELGYSLVRLVDASRGGDLLERITALRKQLAGELGMLVPPIRIRDDMRLDSHLYVFRIRGEKVASGKLYANQLIAVASHGTAAGKLIGRPAVDPIGGKEAFWIGDDQRTSAHSLGYSVCSASDTLVRHLESVIRTHAWELLTRQQVVSLLDSLQKRSASLVSETAQKLRVGQIQRVLQNLLREQVSIRDLETILETLCEASRQTVDVDVLTEQVRLSLNRSLSRKYCTDDGKLRCICLEADLEDTIAAFSTPAGARTEMPADLGHRVAAAIGDAMGKLEASGYPPVVLCSPQARQSLRRLLSESRPQAAVLSYGEVDSVEVEPAATVKL